MARSYGAIVGGGAGGAYQAGDKWGFQTVEKLRNDLALLALGCFGRNLYFGGDLSAIGGDGSGAGDFDLIPAVPFVIPDDNGQMSSSPNVTVQVRYFCRVSNAAISVTPKVYDITAAAAATISGAFACSATAADYSGVNQQQTVSLTLPGAKHTFKPQVTVGGAPAANYVWWAMAVVDIYING